MPRNLFEYHPVIGYRFIPGVRARIRHEGGGYLVRCNQLGFRCDHEVTREKPPGTFRILLFGDSNAAGQGVSNRFRFGDLLEKSFTGLQVLNFGLYGTGTDQQYLAYRELASELEHDLLLISPLVGAIVRNAQTHRLTQSAFDGRLALRAKPYFVEENGELTLHHSPVPRGPIDAEEIESGPSRADRGGWRRRLGQLAGAAGLRNPDFLCWLSRLRRLQSPAVYKDPRNPVWRLTRAILKRWILESSAPVAIAPIPGPAHIRGCTRSESYMARYAELAEETGARVVDLMKILEKQDRRTRDQCRFPTDPHPTPTAHALFAEALAPHVENWMDRR